MNKVTMLPTEDRTDARRRLHLRDITNELPAEAESVGADLRAARLRRGEDLRTIAQVLRIGRDMLEALEEGRNEDLPARAYAVGFVRSYAEYLGLDSRHVVERYKAELDHQAAAAHDLHFPDAAQERRLPKGTFLIVMLVIGAGAYGGWLLTKSTDEMIAARAPAGAAIHAPASVDTAALPASRGDSASAATPGAGAVPAVRVQGMTSSLSTGQSVAPQPVYDPAPFADAPPAVSEFADEASALGIVEEEASTVLSPLPEGTPYGAENVDGRVVVRARRDGAWIRVEDANGKVLIEQTLKAGDSYRAPSQPGVILVARDASAFELMVDGQSLGLAGPATLVLTGKSLYAADLLAAMPKPVAEVEAGAEGEPAVQ